MAVEVTSPQRSRGLDGNVRGLIVLGLAVVIGFVLLAKSGNDSGANVTTSGAATTTTAAGTGGQGAAGATTSSVPKSTTTAPNSGGATGTTRAPTNVSVVVLNGSGGIKGVAAAATNKIKAKGYKTLSPGNAATVDKTIVYYTEGYQADAVAVAGALGQPATSVAAVPANRPAGTSGANVIVVLGKDTPPAT